MKDSNYFDPRDHEAFVREMDNAAYLAAVGPGMLPKGAIPKRRGMTMHQHLSSANVVARITVPFWLPPGDGGATGLAFSGNGGDFTLSAAIIANIGMSLNGSYCYFDANFGGSGLPSGWYWTEWSNDVTGKVFLEQYVIGSGQPHRPAIKTPIPTNLTGRITGTVSEITGPSGFVLSGNALGPNGLATCFFSMAGPTTGTKTYRMKLDGTTVFANGTTTSPVADSLHILTCADSVTEKQLGRTSGSAFGSVGAAATAFASTNRVSIDTSIDREVSFTLQQNNTSGVVLLRADLTASHGA